MSQPPKQQHLFCCLWASCHQQIEPELLICQHSRGENTLQQGTSYRLAMPIHKTNQKFKRKFEAAQHAHSSACACLGSGAKHATCSAQQTRANPPSQGKVSTSAGFVVYAGKTLGDALYNRPMKSCSAQHAQHSVHSIPVPRCPSAQ